MQSHKKTRKTLPKSTETQSMTMQAHTRLVPTYQQEEWTAERLTIHHGKKSHWGITSTGFPVSTFLITNYQTGLYLIKEILKRK